MGVVQTLKACVHVGESVLFYVKKMQNFQEVAARQTTNIPMIQ